MEKFSQKSIEELGNYVYLLINSENNKVFYVGKGQKNRIFDHELENNEEKDKNKKIVEIKNNGYKVIRKILRYNLDKKTAEEVESSIIDYIGKENLTNIVSGSHPSGMYTVEEFESIFAAEAVAINDPIIAIRINKFYERNITEQRLYDVTRFCWTVDINRLENVRYIFAVYKGLVKEVYVSNEWIEIKQKDYIDMEDIVTCKLAEKRIVGRKYFNGEIAPEDIRKKYKNKAIKEYLDGRYPIRYFNC